MGDLVDEGELRQLLAAAEGRVAELEQLLLSRVKPQLNAVVKRTQSKIR